MDGWDFSSLGDFDFGVVPESRSYFGMFFSIFVLFYSSLFSF